MLWQTLYFHAPISLTVLPWNYIAVNKKNEKLANYIEKTVSPRYTTQLIYFLMWDFTSDLWYKCSI